MSSRILNFVNYVRSLFSFFAPPATSVVQVIETPKSTPFYPDPKKKVVREKCGKSLTVKVVGLSEIKPDGTRLYLVKRPRYDTIFSVPASQLRPRSSDIIAT